MALVILGSEVLHLYPCLDVSELNFLRSAWYSYLYGHFMKVVVADTPYLESKLYSEGVVDLIQLYGSIRVASFYLTRA